VKGHASAPLVRVVALLKYQRSTEALIAMAYDPNRPERPRAEPEIIPPDRDGGQADWRRMPYNPWRGRGFEELRGSQRVYVGRIGPFGIALLLLAVAAIIGILMIAVLGAVLIWIPVLAVAIVLAALFRLFRK
jgi:hypothetical protein